MGRYLIPLIIFCVLVGFFAVGLNKDPRLVPSPLVDKAAPQFATVRLREPDAPITETIFGDQKVSLFNVWASWCVACRQEHPFLLQLARERRLPVYGLNYKDDRSDAIAWLDRLGDPYTASAHDLDGKIGIDWGVYGVPETFVVDARGIIRYKHIGPLNESVWKEKLLPVIERVEKEQG